MFYLAVALSGLSTALAGLTARRAGRDVPCAGGVQTSAGGRPGLGGRVAVGPDGDAAELAAVRCS